MKQVLKNRKGLSTVVTTLIILVVSVLLATVVTFYAINVTTTRVQEESLQLFKQHIWHNGTTFAEYNKTTDTINNDLSYNSTLTDGGTITIGTTPYTFSAATDDLILKSGWTMIVYVANPDHVSVGDIGVTIGINVFTANAQYYKECNVEASL